MKKQANIHIKNQVRIISGQWRGRKITFPDKLTLRPTADRVKETLFNWLAPVIVGARCLELYAGSASLSFEALSRHATFALAVEKDPDVVDAIEKNAAHLDENLIKEGHFKVFQADCLEWLRANRPSDAFNIVFIDPPYAESKLYECFDLLSKEDWMAENALIYFEANAPILTEKLPPLWNIVKEKRAGQVYYYLAMKDPNKVMSD